MKRYGKIAAGLLINVTMIVVILCATKLYSAPGSDYGFLLYNNTDYTLTTPWMQLVNKSDGKTFLPSDGTFSLSNDVKLTDVRPTTITTANGFAFTIPSNLPDGEYDVLIKDSANGSESTSDVTRVGFRLLMPDRIMYNPLVIPQDLGRVRFGM